MASVPTGNVLVVHCAVPDELSAMALQPLIVAPFEVNATVPVGTGDPAGDTVAAKVTVCPEVEGFMLETRLVLVVTLSTT
jgi:hypothetical protein